MKSKSLPFLLTALFVVSVSYAVVSAQRAAPVTNLKGKVAPDASIVASDGTATKFHSVIKNKPTALIFYRGGWCPFCNVHLKDLVQATDSLEKMGYQLIAISPDTAAAAKQTVDSNELNYKVFADPKADLIKAFGIGFQQGNKTLPVPAVYLLDKNGKVIFEHLNPNYQERLSKDEILKAARSAK